MKLTKRIVERTTYSGNGRSRCVFWDSDVRGFGLRITSGGVKSYVLSYRSLGRTKRLLVLARANVLTVQEARQNAREALVGLAKGIDPKSEKARLRLEAATGTVAKMVEAYIDGKTMKRLKATRWYLTSFIAPKLGSRPWGDVRRSEVTAWYQDIESNSNANRALNLLRAAFSWRILADDASPLTVKDPRNPCSGVTRRVERPRQVRLELKDLPKLNVAIDAEPSPYLRALFRFILVTGCRKGEALGLRRDDVRLADPAIVTFRDTKNGTDRATPLSAAGVSLIESLPMEIGNPFVFCGEQRKAIANPHKSWDRIRNAAGLAHLTIHDLRRSVGSWLGDAGLSSKQIGKLLGHTSDVTSRVYMALGEESSRAAVEKLDELRQALA